MLYPASLVHPGKNVIAVRVFDHAGEGGFGGGAMSIGPVESEAMSLRGVWDYKVELALEPKHPDWGTRPEPVGASNQNNPERALQRDDCATRSIRDSRRHLVSGRK